MLDRFMAKVEPTHDGCWQWTAARHRDGYGLFKLNGRMVLAHRVIYESEIGEIPADHDLHHTCERPWCVNPQHLIPLTRLDHVALTERFHPVECPRGHSYDSGNTYVYPDGRRVCRRCERDRKTRRREALTIA